MFTTGRFPFKYGQCVYNLPGGGVIVLNQDRMASFSRQDGYSIGQDGKCNNKPIEIHDRTFSWWMAPQSRYRVVEGW